MKTPKRTQRVVLVEQKKLSSLEHMFALSDHENFQQVRSKSKDWKAIKSFQLEATVKPDGVNQLRLPTCMPEGGYSQV